jgi:hypothetical protein
MTHLSSTQAPFQEMRRGRKVREGENGEVKEV